MSKKGARGMRMALASCTRAHCALISLMSLISLIHALTTSLYPPLPRQASFFSLLAIRLIMSFSISYGSEPKCRVRDGERRDVCAHQDIHTHPPFALFSPLSPHPLSLGPSPFPHSQLTHISIIVHKRRECAVNGVDTPPLPPFPPAQCPYPVSSHSSTLPLLTGAALEIYLCLKKRSLKNTLVFPP